jgi:hypothetical protein
MPATWRPFLNSIEMTLEPSLRLGIDPDADYPDQNVVLSDDDRLTLSTDRVPFAAVTTM